MMKKIPILLIILFFACNFSFGQKKIGVVDINKLIENHPKKLIYDSIYTVKEYKLNDTIKYLQDSLQTCFKFFIQHAPPPGDRTIDSLYTRKFHKTLKNIKYLEVEIYLVYNEGIKELETLKREHKSALKGDIEKMIDKYLSENNFIIIYNKESTLYYKTEIEMTSVFEKLLNNNYN